jgi:hypothetical protein
MFRTVNSCISNLWKSLSKSTRRLRGRRNEWSSQAAMLEARLVLDAGVGLGDLVVVAYNSSDEVPQGSIALMALADIPDGQTVFITDRGWQTSTNSLRPFGLTETSITWVTSGVTAGKIIRIATGVPNILEPVSKPVCRAFKRVAAGWSFSTTV